jgi:hypothetical protein
MNRLINTVLVIFAASAMGCRAPDQIEFRKVAIELGACASVCPQFNLSVDENALISYQGLRHVSTPGARSAQMTALQFEAVKQAIKALDEAKLEASYLGAPQCPTMQSAQAVVKIELQQLVNNQARNRSIFLNLGCRDQNGNPFPAALHRVYIALAENTPLPSWLRGTNPN